MSDQLRLDDELASEVESATAVTPTPQQRRAIESRDRDVLLEAGAGTGKTRVLVDRYCAAVTEDGVGIDGVVAFTFTDRAAAEMRHRIRGELTARAEAAARGGEADAAAELAALARDSERAWISTIHAFCKRLLSAHPVALGLDPRFRVMDEAETDRVAARAFDRALERLLEEHDAETARMVAAIRIPRLRDMVRTAHDELRAQGHAQPELPPARPSDPGRAVAELARAARSALEELSDSSAGRGNVERIEAAARLSPDGEPYEESVIAAVELGSQARAFAGPACRAYREAWKAARRAIVERDSAGLYGRLAELVGLFAVQFAELKESRSALDFEDLQLEAVRLLRDHPAIAESYLERFRHVLIDEFQDTNELQLMLVRLLQGPETRVFTVGDEFQSIYGFRHADVRVFRRERERLKQLPDQAAVLPLSGNFRSLPGVLAAVNSLGDAILEDFRPLTVGRVDRPRNANGHHDPSVELLLTPGGAAWKDHALRLDLPGDYPSAPDRVAEARFLAARLRRLREGGARRRDMVVLLRAFTHVAAYEEELQRAGLAPYVVGGRGYWSQQQVDDVRRLLSTIANPLDDDCLFGMLASPACGVLPDTLWLLRRAAGERRHVWPTLERHFGAQADGAAETGEDEQRWIAQIPGSDVERLGEICAALAELRGEAGYVGLDVLVELAVTRTGYDLAVLAMTGGRRRLANVRKLMRMARQFETAEGRDLRGFLDHLEERATRDREGEAATEAEDHDGVRVMTVHAAKGLQFPIVAVADLGRELLRFGRGPDVRIEAARADPAPEADELPTGARVGIRLARFGSVAVGLFDHDELADEAAREEAAESCRLAYVAATRAEDHLILSGCYDPAKVSKPVPEEGLKPSVPITERLMRALDIVEPPQDAVLEVPPPEPRPGLEARFGTGRIAVRLNRPDPDAFAALGPGRPEEGAERSDFDGSPPLARPATLPEPAAGHLSYSALSSYERCGYRFYIERVVGMPGLDPHAANGDGSGSGSQQRFGFGNAVHALLEWSARHGWREPPQGLVVGLLNREGIGAHKLEQAMTMVRAWLDSGFRRQELADPEARARPEMPFMLRLGDSIVRGTMDLLVTGADGALVVDYKTDSLADATPGELVDRYGVQRKIYALAAGSAPDRPVRTAYAFLDQGGEVVTHDFEPADLEDAAGELEELIGQVRAGRFEVTPDPHHALCWDCPARARLCSHPLEATGRRP
jgi:ATP-dependent helicase/nuclease subunit A